MELPDGAIARVEASRPHRDFLSAAEPDWAEIKLTDVQSLVERGETAESWAPNTNFVVTSMIEDRELAKLRVEEELLLIDAFEPAVCVPGDVSVYPEEPPRVREESIKQSMKNAIYIANESTSPNTVFIPIVKGFTPHERRLSYAVLPEFPHNCMCFYAVTYFSAAGNQKNRFLNDLEQIDTEHDGDLLVVGTLSSVLDEAPTNIRGSAGQHQWQKRVSPCAGVDETHASRVWDELEADVTDWLSVSPKLRTSQD